MAYRIASLLGVLAVCVFVFFESPAVPQDAPKLGAIACEPKINGDPELPSVTRGQSVTVYGACLSGQAVKARLRTGKRGDNSVTTLDSQATDDGNTLSFEIPKTLEPGRYLVTVAFGSNELAVPGDLRVLSPQQAKVEIVSISPATVYPTNNNTYDFAISGENLAINPNGNIIEDVDRGPQPVGTLEECKQYASGQNYRKMCLSYDHGMEGRKLNVTGFSAGSHQGTVNIVARVGDDASESKTIKLSSTPEWAVRALAIAVSAMFGLIVLGMVLKGIRLAKAGESGSVLDWFFLDKQTNSYSLSKFQLVAWTAVAVFGYVYVLFSRTLIQNDFTFPAVPNGWPTLLGLSAATTVAAVGLTSSRGSKGAGPLGPSLADFISTGGVVTGDRFQFFVWTLVGFLGFVMLVLLTDPSTLKTLPDVPEGFLYLMGISAAGYLGGKAVRLPGPVIHQLLASAEEKSDAAGKETVLLTILVKGENLSTDAAIKVDGAELLSNTYEIKDAKAQTSPAPADTSFCSELSVVVKEAEKYTQGAHELTFTNKKDGQMAVAKFPIDPLKLGKIADQLADSSPVSVKVTGEHFGDNMTAEWVDPSAKKNVIGADDVKKSSDKEAAVKLTPGTTKGQGTLTLISANHLRASSPVQVN
jgi:hypothetical protein